MVTTPNSTDPSASRPADSVSPEEVDIVTISPSTVISWMESPPMSAARTDVVAPDEIACPSWSKTLTVASVPTFWAVTTTSSSTASASPGKYEGSSRSNENNTLWKLPESVTRMSRPDGPLRAPLHSYRVPAIGSNASVSITSPLGPWMISPRAAPVSAAIIVRPLPVGHVTVSAPIVCSVDVSSARSTMLVAVADTTTAVESTTALSSTDRMPVSMRASSSPCSSSTITRPVRSSTSTIRFHSALTVPNGAAPLELLVSLVITIAAVATTATTPPTTTARRNQ